MDASIYHKRWLMYCEKNKISPEVEWTSSIGCAYIQWVNENASEYEKLNNVSVITDHDDFDKFIGGKI